MLIAVTTGGQRQVASAQARGQDFLCPHCGNPVLVRLPKDRVPHFAHRAGSACPYRLNRAQRRALAKERAAQRRAQARLGEYEAAGQEALFDLP